MIMASSTPSFCNYRSLSCKNDHKPVVKYPRIRSQSFRDEGKSTSIVDANLKVLRERMEQVRKKERLHVSPSSSSTLSCRRSNNHCYGWKYESDYVPKHKREGVYMSMGEVIGSASGALAFSFLSGSLCICLVSLLAHLFTASS